MSSALDCMGLCSYNTSLCICRHTESFEHHLDTLSYSHAAGVVQIVSGRIMAASKIYPSETVSCHTNAILSLVQLCAGCNIVQDVELLLMHCCACQCHMLLHSVWCQAKQIHPKACSCAVVHSVLLYASCHFKRYDSCRLPLQAGVFIQQYWQSLAAWAPWSLCLSLQISWNKS